MVRSLNSIVAVCQNMGIGKDGNLPWPPLRNEYKYFQRMTSTSHVEGKQNALIMGKKTWFSIPEKNRPLKDRINIVLSRELKEAPKGAHYLSKSLDDALALLDTPELKDKVDMVWIVGGTSVYKESCCQGTGRTSPTQKHRMLAPRDSILDSTAQLHQQKGSQWSGRSLENSKGL
ncbi:dihydrofolate reductase isoform X2 [Coturnix japonica]|uniref:dihydrofolate reductase isoform X2 n=1 Tax=Coturnix japonica TaxID=93934 RepID=UPI0013A5E389|nr:dihydrofolate reductase isoform X2 [Coturnix japonica]